MSTCVSFQNVSRRYGSAVAVEGLAFEVETGEVMGLLGPNGAGKTTSMLMLCGLVRPSSGTMSVFGKETRRAHVEIASRMGVVFERPAFFEYLSARRNLKLQTRLARHRGNIDRILDMVGLLGAADVRAGRLSHGMRQRLALAQALVTEPALLVLDEPTAGMDAESTEEILRLLRRLASDAKVTILFSSHLMYEIETLCDRVAIMNAGKLVGVERTSNVLSYDLTDVEVLLDGAEGAAKRLLEKSWVSSVEVKPGRLHVRMRDGDVHQLNTFLTNAGYQPSGLIPRRRTLRDYFLKTMGG